MTAAAAAAVWESRDLIRKGYDFSQVSQGGPPSTVQGGEFEPRWK